ncbi:hypothetical protein [Nitratireductor aquibiodomus]|uniref:hypothetical protein n=1 Tax=Nitratireductor aquibiodomus TaxID=204799 RepID=UPI001FCAAAD8|nr:hypothetical protein [Nitratireductor aquibiodomus]
MKLVTHFEAATRSTAELRCLLKKAFAVAASTPPCSQARRNALASIHTIEFELARRTPHL